MDTPLKNDGIIDIAIGLQANSKRWRNTRMAWSELVGKLSHPTVTNETYKQFMAASKEEQGRIKDVGGFVGGYLSGGVRGKNSVTHRQLICLDADFSHKNLWWDFTMMYGCAACLHSTHKSSPDKPRHRLIIPVDRKVSPEEYQAISRKVAESIGLDFFDQSTFDVNRLMFWPTVSSDAEYVFEVQDGPWLKADEVLSRYRNWKDQSEWPQPGNYDEIIRTAAEKQEDPLSKKGIVGVFCRTYSIQEAIEKFLPDVYTEAGPDRYTYVAGTTSCGLICYEDRFAYSHHGTDPASGRLCNAFDLVRIHRFGHLDSGKERNEQESKSYKAMEEFAANDGPTRKHIAEERFAEAKYDFAESLPQDALAGEVDMSWTEELDTNTKGEYTNTAQNLNLIIQHDHLLKGAFRFNLFDNKRYVAKSLPWRAVDGLSLFRDVDFSGLRNYIECVYGITASQKVDDALALEFERNCYHPIKDYLTSLVWDGTPRVDTLLQTYFGAEDNAYTRAAMRKMLCAAVARVFEPGVKFDLVVVLVGEQGTYKSTFIKKLGREWFSDTFTTVSGKEAFEQLQGAWIVEIAELSGLKKAEVETIKHFITKREDSYRPAYGRVVETYKRQCVFFGTTNNKDFLRDVTGNRRFLPIDARSGLSTRSVIDNLTEEEIGQIWAESYALWKQGEPLYLSPEEESIAQQEQERHSEVDERLGLVDDFLQLPLPEDWDNLDLLERRMWLDDPLAKKGTEQRNFVCVAEVWCECLRREKSDMTRYNTRDINDLLKLMPDWEFVPSTKNFPVYGKQKYYRRR